jgi:hypothetical protein
MADKSFINMKAGDKPRGANENSTFNGTVLTIGRPEVIAKITDIRVAKSQTDDKTAFATNNLTSIFNDLSQYTYNGSIISLKSFHQRIRIEYEKPEVTQAEFEAAASPEMLAFQQKFIADIGGPMRASASTLNVQEITGNASPFNVLGATFGGFKGLQEGSKPTANFTKRVRIAKMEPGAADGSGDATSSQTSNLTTLFKKTNLSTNNLNKVVFTQGSVNAIMDELKVRTSANSSKIKETAQSVLPTNLSTKILEQATTAIDDKDAGITVESKMTKEVQTEVKTKLREAQNAGIDLDPNALIPGAGRSGSNTFANLLGKVKGIKAQFPPSVKNLMKGLPDGVIPPKLNTKIPNIIEGVDPITGKLSLDTNTNKLIQKGSLTPNMSPSNISNLGFNKSTWAGYNTPKTYKFEFVDTSDELETEFSNSSRMKTGTNNQVVAFIVGWTDKIWGPPEKVNASSIHEISKTNDLQNLINSEKNIKSALVKINAKPKIYGIQAHYLILTDGRIQRGRPIDETRNPDTSSFDLTGVQVTIVANTENPVNDEQLASLKKLISKAYKVVPGLNLFGDYEMDQNKLGPAIDMDSLRDVYGKANSITNPEEGGNGPSRKEMVFTKPSVIAQGSKTKSVEPFSFSKIQKDFEKIDLATGKELPPDAQKDLDAGLKAFDDLKKGKIDIDKGISQAINDPKNSAAKLQGDAIIGKLTGGFDKNKISVDSIAKKLDTSNLKKLFRR